MIKKALALLLVIAPLFIHAQQYNLINYSIRDGVAATQTRSITQDDKGFLWIGTIGGVSRFDGKEFINYSIEDGLIDNRTNVVFLDSKDQLWLGTKGGLNLYCKDTFQQFLFEEDYAEIFVLAIAEAPNGDLWIGTQGGGAVRFNGETFSYFDTGLADNTVRSIVIDEEGVIWLGTVGGLSSIHDATPTENAFDQLFGTNISSLLMDSMHNLWIGTARNGVYRLHDNQLDQFTTQNGLISQNVEHLYQDRSSNIWISSLDGLTKYENGVFTAFSQIQSPSFTRLKSLFEDNEGNLWLTSDASGIYKFSGEAFVNYTIENGICSDYVMSFVEDADNNLWFSTYGDGICRQADTAFVTYTMADGLASNKVWCSLRDQQNRLWFGTSSGITLFENGRMQTPTALNDSLSDTKITALYQTQTGEIWVGHRNGASRWNGTNVENFTQRTGFPGIRVRSIHKSTAGEVWFACSNGLVRLSDGNFQSFSMSDGLSNNTVYSIVEDKKGGLWFGTENGLTFYDGKAFHKLRMARHFSSNNTAFLLIDDKHRLWIGTYNGLFRLNLDDYYEKGREEFKLFTDLDGIKSLETNLNAAFKDHTGKLWMGTSLGTVRFDPNKEKVIRTDVEPYINISEIRLFLEPTDWHKYTKTFSSNGLPKDLRLRHNKNYLTFYYTGISHTNPEKVQYQFMLEGFDESWSPLTSATFATYSNLPHGSYTFMVKARNKDGVWNSEPATFSFELRAPFWQTWWFFLMVAVGLLLLAWMVYSRRKAAEKQRREREQLINRSKMMALEQQTLNSSMNRHFIFNALNSIQYYINRQDRLAANKYLSSFARLVRKNLDSSQTNVVTLADELDRLELYLTLEHMRFANKFEYAIHIDKDVDPASVMIPAMLLQPFVENSIWHGLLPMESGGKITLNFSKQADRLYILIDDNGIGIEASLERKGQHKNHISQGMNITSGRLRLLKEMTNETLYVKGPYEKKDDNGKVLGTRVEIVLPYDYAAVMDEKMPENLVSQ